MASDTVHLDPGHLEPGRLTRYVRAIFEAAGSAAYEAALLADHLVEANLVGHDSHGVIRVEKYVDWRDRGMVVPNRRARVVTDAGPILVVDGDAGYGQPIAAEAMALAIPRARALGTAILGIRGTGHLGRIGAWAETAAAAGLVSVHFVNTSGFGILVAPHGGSDRRLSANPFAAGIPVAGRDPIILDMATSIIAEGKIQVTRNRGGQLPEGCVLDGDGRPTRDPARFYADPPGAILPFGGHKGYGLGLVCEVLAGALTGGGSSHPGNDDAWRLINNMMTVLVDPAATGGPDGFAADVTRLVDWVTASPPLDPDAPVQVPGDVERRTRAERTRSGIPIDPETRAGLDRTAARLGVDRELRP